MHLHLHLQVAVSICTAPIAKARWSSLASLAMGSRLLETLNKTFFPEAFTNDGTKPEGSVSLRLIRHRLWNEA
jgi:hypothetical protein